MVRSPRLVARYRELKSEADGCLLLMQVGAFMQVMGETGRRLSRVGERVLVVRWGDARRFADVLVPSWEPAVEAS